MTYTTSAAYRILVAQAVMGDAVVLLPATLKLGNGHYDAGTGVLTSPTPSETDLAAPIVGLTGLPITVTRSGQVIRITATVTGSATPVEITEAGIFLANGTMVLIDVFRPRTLVDGVPFGFAYSLLPEVN